MEVTGISVEKAQAIEGQLVESAVVNDNGFLVMTRKNSTTINAGKVKPDLLDAWPVGSVYMSMVATDPRLIFGGTWIRLAKGKMLVNVDEDDPNMDAPGDTGGAKKVQLSVAEMPQHSHTGPSHNHDATHGHTAAGGTFSPYVYDAPERTVQYDGSDPQRVMGRPAVTRSEVLVSVHTNHMATGLGGGGLGGPAGSGQEHENMPPYLAVYMFQRTG